MIVGAPDRICFGGRTPSIASAGRSGTIVLIFASSGQQGADSNQAELFRGCLNRGVLTVLSNRGRITVTLN
jgi:hypothetical protein